MRKAFFTFIFLGFVFVTVSAQENQDSTQREGVFDQLFDFGDMVINVISGEKWAVIPALIYSPETSLGVGARAIRVFRPEKGNMSVLRPSTLPITLIYTLNNQTIFTTELDLWLNENKDFINSRIELSNFPFYFFGIGNDPLPKEEGELYGNRYVYFHANYLRRIGKGIYIGPRYEFRADDIYNRVEGGVLETSKVPGYDGQLLSGIGLNLNYDTRDNIFQPTKGWYNRLAWMGFTPVLGSNFTFNQYTLDFRKYFKTFGNQVLALQSWWSFTTGGPTFQHISLIGGSDRMRGFFEGRFRDNHAQVQQAEYRIPIYRNLGLVVFGHAGQVAREVGEFNMRRMRYGAGFGFRYKINKEGLNIRLDIAFGDQTAFYFGLNEVI
ncbi:BamA/TamA family outer membrane protein [Shivajiella indica]|uniref:BamA/TamA family outer membrane protein n=1 Tax=Shivajiella indica TaxID=872115 RepID=A0ABW5B6S2_9BACT